MALGFTVEFTSAFSPVAPVVTTISNGPASWQSNPMIFKTALPVKRRHGSLCVLQSAKIIPYAFRSVGVALACKAFKVQMQKSTADALVLLATGLMSYFNFAVEDNDRLKSAKRAVKRFNKNSEDDLKEDAEVVSTAKKWKSAVRVKLVCEFLSLLCMVAAKTSRDVHLGATAVVGSTIVFLLMGGGRFQHNASGRLNPVEVDFLSKAYKLDISIAVAAFTAAFLKPSVWKQICTGYVSFGYFGAALQGIAPKSKAKKKLSKAVFGKNAPTPNKTTEQKSEE